MNIETERLILRPLEESDVENVAELANNLEVSKWLEVLPYPYTVDDALDWIRRNKEKWNLPEDEREDYSFGIELKEEGRIIGGIGFHKVDYNIGKAAIGYWIGEPYWKKGYGSEALEALIDFAFNNLNLRRIEASVFPGNPSSGKLLEKFGFVREGLKRQSVKCKATGEIKDEEVYGLLKEEYRFI